MKGCERSAGRGNEVAFAVAVEADASVKRRGDFRVAEIEFRLLEFCFRSENGGVALHFLGFRFIVFPAGNRVFGKQGFLTLVIAGRVFLIRPGFEQVCFRCGNGGFVLLRFNLKEKLSFFDQFAVFEIAFQQKALHAGDKVDGVECHDIADGRHVFDIVRFRRRDDDNAGNDGSGSGFLFAGGGGKKHPRGQNCEHQRCFFHLENSLLRSCGRRDRREVSVRTRWISAA